MMQLRKYNPVSRMFAAPALLLLGLFSGCQPPVAATDAESPNRRSGQVRISPVEPRIDVLAGRPVLIPVRLTPPITPVGSYRVDVSIEGVDPIGAQLLWISAAPAMTSEPSDPLAAWIDRPQEWSARTPAQLVEGEPPPGDGFWALRIDPPRNAHERTLYISGLPAPVQWLQQPAETAFNGDKSADLFQEPSPALQRTLTNTGRDPLNRWRTRLLDDRLRGPRLSVIDSHAMRFGHEAIEIMAQQAEWRWRLALDRLSRIDPFLGAELLDRLTAIARFDEQIQAPVWPTNDTALIQLRTALLDPDLADATKIERTLDTLRSSPPSTAWIIDDAGLVDPATGRTITLLGVADRMGRAGLVRGSIGDRSGPSAPLPAFGVARATILAPAPPDENTLEPAPIRLEVIGQKSGILDALPVGLPVKPPGFRLGPGFTPWTLEHWSANTPRFTPADVSFYALLHRRAPGITDTSSETYARNASWQLQIECPTASEADPGLLRVHLGPSNAPIAIFRVDPAGLLTDEISGPLQREGVAIRTTPDAWIATIDIPPNAVEPDGILRLAIERYNKLGRRATWPRPTLPWQTSPGRAALNLGAWNSLTPDD